MESFTEEDLKEMILRLAHEIRNPLATIKSGIQLVLHLTKPEGEIREYLDNGLAEVSRIDRTVKDMQKFIRLSEGAPQAVPLARAVAEAASLKGEEAFKCECALRTEDSPACAAWVDPRNLQLALMELLSNACRYSPPGSEVRVSWLPLGEDHVALRVEDQCGGIGPAVSQSMLKPFFSASTQGTGLGLNTVDRICRLAGGRLEWENLPERGCRFTLVLPGA